MQIAEKKKILVSLSFILILTQQFFKVQSF